MPAPSGPGPGSAGVAPRLLAARALDATMHRGRSLRAELAAALPQLPDPRDRALLEAICLAALRRHARYDAALRAWMPRPPGPRDGLLRALLFAGLAQLDVLRLPAHAALSATVEAARAAGLARQAGLVNALLRRAQREGVPASPPAQSWPPALRERIQADWPDRAEAIFAASAEPPPLWLRVNRARTSRAAYAARLGEEAGIEARTDPGLADALRLDVPVPVAALPGFAAGEASVQDGAAQKVADALAPLPPGARVLDACAAPGGKAAHLLEREPGLRLLALDIDARRLTRVEETLARIGAQARCRAGDAAEPAQWWDGTPFDAILLDAPCSATGIVRRQPDILLHRRPEDLDALAATQRRLLRALWPTLQPGGVLVYATCSVLKAENERQVDAFLRETADARVEPLDASFGHAAGAGRQRFPGEDGMDGFFYARLRKTPPSGDGSRSDPL